jgi:hypothetical protein
MPYVGLAIVAVVLVLLVVFLAKKRPAQSDSRPSRPAATAAPAPAALKAPKRHLIVNPTTTFENLAGALRRTGFTIEAEQTGEPTAASWRAGSGIVRYTYEPEIDLRKLEVIAPASECSEIIDHIVNGNAYVATIDHQLPGYLEPAKSIKELLFGIRGAEWIGRGEDHKFYWEKVGKLRGHSDPRVAAEATRVHDVLVAEAGGTPIPSGPRGLPLVWTKSGNDYVATNRGASWVYKPDGTVTINGTPLEDKITEWPARWTKA